MSNARYRTRSIDEAWPTPQELELLFLQKHGSLERVGWAPKRRFRFRYFLPAEVYEAIVYKLVLPGCVWLDVGGGHAPFCDNPSLSRELILRCARFVVVDPSNNVKEHAYANEKVQ